MQTQSNLLEKLSSYNMGRFSQLVSTIIVKSWPIKNGQPEDDFDEVLHHMLTWPDIKHIFSFNGMSVVFIGVYKKLFAALLFPLCRAVNKYIKIVLLFIPQLKAQGIQPGFGEKKAMQEGASIPFVIIHCSHFRICTGLLNL